jgi:N-sulfoglucosamine sulfohydrolase
MMCAMGTIPEVRASGWIGDLCASALRRLAGRWRGGFAMRLLERMKSRVTGLSVVLIVATALVPAARGGGPDPAGRPPNIVMIVADDLGTTLGCYGDKVAKTPNIDRLAAEGVRFSHAFCTTASCSPSRSVILSGRHNHATGQYGLEHATHHFRSFEHQKTLPVVLEQAGYRTARVGKFHVAPVETYRFQTVLPGNARNGAQMADNCRAWLAEKSEAPFFLYFCTADPHRSGGRGRIGAVDPFGNGPNQTGADEAAFPPESIVVPPFLPDTPGCRAELAQYYQSVARVDRAVGRLVDLLAETGHVANTVIMVLSDNGIAFPGAKTTLYEPGMRLPLVVKSPGLKRRGIINNAMVSWADLAPTVMDFAGVQDPPPMHGRSFRDILDEERPPGWDHVFGSHSFHEVTMYYPMRVLRERRYKLIHNLAAPLEYPFASDLWSSAVWQETLSRKAEYYGMRRTRDFLHRGEWELYDLESDPHEIKNLAGQPEGADVLDAMQKKLRAFQTTTGDPWTVKFTHE